VTVVNASLALVSVMVALAATPVIRRYASARGIVDEPGPRRSHEAPVPRGGGLALALAGIPAALAGAPSEPAVGVFAAGALVITGLGWLDDRMPRPAGLRLGVQGAVALAAVLVLGPVEPGRAAGIELGGAWLWSGLAVVALVWLINLFNFMDGSDGLAATQSLLTCAMFAVVFVFDGSAGPASVAIAMGAAALGFLFWNWPRAGIFLGDSGSLLLGWTVGLLALAGSATGSVSVWLSFILASPFVVDSTATLCWRLARGERWYTPHRDHAYQCLLRAGWSHRGVLLTWIAANALVVVPAAAVVVLNPALDSAVAAVVGSVLTGGWCLVHFVHQKEYRTK